MATAGIERRVDIEIPAGKERISGWLYASQKYTAADPGPAIVIAHGLGGTKEMRLDVFADKFNQRGYTVVVFDYRFNGHSTGVPRGLINWGEQQKDWHTAIAYTRNLEVVDAERVGLFGSSFSGGHVIQLGAADKRLKAIISQCPFTDGLRSAFTTGFTTIPKLLWLGTRDALFGSDEHPVTVRLAGKPGEVALMNAHDAYPGYKAICPPGMGFLEEVPARVVNQMAFLRPGGYASKVKSPLLVAICGKDTVAPPKASLNYAKKAPKDTTTIKYYDDMGHFDIYVGEAHVKAFNDYFEFLETHLPA